MLESITINNIALIDNLTIEFSKGLNVLSGETGAGKSLIIDSISLLLGERADKSLISYGKNSASVEAVFIPNINAINVAQDLGLDDNEKLIISRKITIDGKNDCRVNGKSFTLSMLKKLTAPLMDLHGQFEHQSLLQVSNHLKILDSFGRNEILPLKNKFKEEFLKYQDIKTKLKDFTVDEKERERLIDLYKYQIEEIENANFKDNEEDELKAQHLKIAHAEKIADGINSAFNCLVEDDGNSSALSNIERAIYSLSQISNYEPEIAEILDRLNGVNIEIDDIAQTLSSISNEQYYDVYESKKVEERLDLLFSFKKKYGSSIEEINRYLQTIKSEYNKLSNCSEFVDSLNNELNKIKEQLLIIGTKLTTARKQVAKIFSNQVDTELKELGLGGSNFEVSFEQVDLDNCNEFGLDKVEFLFSANIGQPAKPLIKVISGGEMSRVMLALKTITADIEGVDTMIFDEIDTGVSGHMAKVLAQKMQKVAFMHQVLCVTHMAQICAYANNNYFISKKVQDGKTRTFIKLITGKEKEEEVARLVGSSSSSSALMHAKELITEGEEFFKSLK